MTQITITIPEDLAKAIDRDFPQEAIQAIVERALRVEVTRKAGSRKRDLQSVLAAIDDIRSRTNPQSNEAIWQLRQEGRK